MLFVFCCCLFCYVLAMYNRCVIIITVIISIILTHFSIRNSGADSPVSYRTLDFSMDKLRQKTRYGWPSTTTETDYCPTMPRLRHSKIPIVHPANPWTPKTRGGRRRRRITRRARTGTAATTIYNKHAWFHQSWPFLTNWQTSGCHPKWLWPNWKPDRSGKPSLL